ncbi:MAG: HPr kinase [Gemmatimonadetes bacterium]|nr:HPr kinase [Gemmatimonadota bacterium]
MRIHGLAIQATVALPGLATTDSPVADVVFELVDHLAAPTAVRTRYRSGAPDDTDSRVEIVDDASGSTSFRYGDGTAFDVVHDTRPARIRAAIAPGQTLEDLAAYLYGPVLGFLLRSWGRLALHASCVRIDDAAVLLAGHSGSGKSTTAAALATRGTPVMSDDLTALSSDGGQFVAWPAFDHVRLWAESELIVLDDGALLDRITPSWDKRRFPLTGASFADDRCPVRAVIVLEPRSATARAVSRPIAPARAVLTLAALTYANYLLDPAMRATELAQLGALARSVPVYSLVPPSGREGVDALCAEILSLSVRHAALRA